MSIAVYESAWVPSGAVLFIDGAAFMRPGTFLRLQYPNSPIWSTRTLGHREADRDRRRQARLGKASHA